MTICRNGEPWLKQWILVTAISWAISWAIGIGLSYNLPILMSVPITVAVSGALVGIGQWLVLRRCMRKAGLWILATIAGWDLGLLVAAVASIPVMALSSLLITTIIHGSDEAASWGRAIAFYPVMLLAIGLGWIIIGIMVGWIQWLVVLRQWAEYADKWAKVTVKSWIVGLVVIAIINFAAIRIIIILGGYDEIWGYRAEWFLLRPALGGIYGAIVGTATGNVIQSLITQISKANI